MNISSLLKSIEEASLSRDREIRKTAEEFFDSMIRFIQKYKDDPDMLVKNRDGSFEMNAGLFWHHKSAPKLNVLLTPKQAGTMRGGIGKKGQSSYIVMPVLKAPNDLSYIDTRLDIDYVVHELFHYLDPGYEKANGSNPNSAEEYYNNPSEWNAYWQEGAAKLERFFRTNKNPRIAEFFVGDGSLKDFTEKAVKGFWDKNFVSSMDKKTRRKFDKRLSQLYQGLKDDGTITQKK